MDKKETLKNRKPLTVLIFLCVVFFAPFFIKPSLLSAKDNDLGRTYIPLLNFVKDSYWQHSSLPLWRNSQLFGEPLIASPVFTPTYPANALFLIFALPTASVLYYFLHFVLASISTFYLARSFSLRRFSSLAVSVFYVFSIKTLLHISAGHITMVAAFCYLPLVFLAVRQVLHGQGFKWILWLAITLSFMLALYVTIFYYTIMFIVSYTVYFLLANKNKANKLKIIVQLSSALLLCICLSAIFLLPQIEFGPLTTRTQLTIADVAIPLWNIKRYATSLFFPYINFNNLGHEAFLYLGFIPTTLTVVGFYYLSNVKRLIVSTSIIIALLFAAGLSTPIFPVAYEYLPFLNYSRVTTRFWFIIALVSALLCGYALDKIKNKTLIKIFLVLFIIETFSIGLLKIHSIQNLSFSNINLYKEIASDNEIFRVYCTTYCFNPQLVSTSDIQTLSGESPIQDKNIIGLLQGAGAYSHKNFAVIFPPYQVWQTDQPPQPNSDLLGLVNVKYVASTYELTNRDFIFDDKYENIYLYYNSKFRSRTYFDSTEEEATITSYQPNKITISYPKSDTPRTLIFSELYYPGWYAYSNGEKTVVEKHDVSSRKITIPSNSNRTELKFEPKSFLIGKAISFSTILFLAIFFWFNMNKRKHG